MPKRILQGVVTSNANEQTVTVSVERRFTHPVLKKTMQNVRTRTKGDGVNRTLHLIEFCGRTCMSVFSHKDSSEVHLL